MKQPIIAEVINTADQTKHIEAAKGLIQFLGGLPPEGVRCMIATIVVDAPTPEDPTNCAVHFISLGTPEQVSRMFMEHYNNTASIVHDLVENAGTKTEEKH